MRAYFFVNMYMQGIHAGIKAGHCMNRINVKYGMSADERGNYSFGTGPVTPERLQLAEFITKHETFVLLNGGDQKSLGMIIQDFHYASKERKNEFPWAAFNESIDALNGAVTCVGIILPQRIYTFAEMIRKDKDVLTFNMEGQFSRYGFAYFDHTHGDDPNYRINNRWEFEFAKNLNSYSLAR